MELKIKLQILGIKDVYMHLIFNGNMIINPNDSISTNINDSLVFYTHKAEVDYQNVEVRTCSDWQRGFDVRGRNI